LHAVGTDRLEVHWSLEDEQRPDFVPARRVPLPWDANALARSDLEALRRWRLELRSHLERALRDGLRVVGLERDPHRREAVYVLAQSGATP
ncbi:MAG: hypothetical protein D6776_01630, partial [Planctomycetota bacterium]